MQEADLTGCSSDSANDKEQHEGNTTLRGIMQSSGSSPLPLIHPPSSPQRNSHLSGLSPSHQHSFLWRQVLCSLAFHTTDPRGAHSPTRHREQVEGAYAILIACLSDEGRFLFSCIPVLSNDWVTHHPCGAVFEKWGGKLSHITRLYFTHQICLSTRHIIKSCISQRPAMPQKLGDSWWHFSLDALKFTSSTPQSSLFLQWRRWLLYCSKRWPEKELQSWWGEKSPAGCTFVVLFPLISAKWCVAGEEAGFHLKLKLSNVDPAMVWSN